MKRTRLIQRLLVGSLFGLGLPACEVARLGQPEALWGLWLVPLLGLFYAYVFRTKRRLLARFASHAMLGKIGEGISPARQRLKAVLVMLAVLAGVVALCQVKIGFTWEEVKRRGVDVVVALDVSDSMLVQDVEAGGHLSRLQRAKREITDLLRLMEGDRVGLVAFAGNAFLECPLTLDYGAAELFLGAMDTDLIPVKGTDLGDALRVSLEAFEGQGGDHQAVILITDGEDHSGRALAVAEEAKKQGVRIFTIGIGRDEGSPIPSVDGGFRRDARGELILSRLDEPTLQKIALTTGGRYVRSVTGDVDLENVYLQGIKATLTEQELGSKRRQRWEDRSQWFIALCLLLLALESLLSERGRPRRRMQDTQRGNSDSQVRGAAAPATTGATRAGVLTLGVGVMVAAGWTPEAWAQAQAQAQAQQQQLQPQQQPTPQRLTPQPPPLQQPSTAAAPRTFATPYAAFEAGDFSQALEGFVEQQVAQPEDPRLHLNIGAAHFKMNDFESAERAFSQAAVQGREPKLQGEAWYNLGNVAYRQGKLDAAIEHYKQALEANPDDTDAKFNLEFVRDEIRRRHEEAKKRQEQQKQQQQENQEQQQQDQEQEQEQEQEQDQQQQQNPEQQQQDQNQDQQQQQQQDQDQQQQGQEQQQRDQRENAGKEQAQAQEQQEQQQQNQEQEAQQAQAAAAQQAKPEGDSDAMSRAEAERLLRTLPDERPDRRPPPNRRGRGRRTSKDW